MQLLARVVRVVDLRVFSPIPQKQSKGPKLSKPAFLAVYFHPTQAIFIPEEDENLKIDQNFCLKQEIVFNPTKVSINCKQNLPPVWAVPF